jgi:hypothetical protein
MPFGCPISSKPPNNAHSRARCVFRGNLTKLRDDAIFPLPKVDYEKRLQAV